MKEFNINSSVKVKLTENGIEILKKRHEQLKQTCPNIGEFRIPQIDEEGYVKFQLWNLMSIFGPHIGAGVSIPFDTNIAIDDELLVDKSNDVQIGMHR